MSSSKGYRREKQAAELYERAGYETFRPPRTQYDETDMFNLFDILAIKQPDEDTHGDAVRLVQVKSNRAAGVQEWRSKALEFASGCVRTDFLVCYDNQGWRLLVPYHTPHGASHNTRVDERDEDGAMGDGVVEYLGGDVE